MGFADVSEYMRKVAVGLDEKMPSLIAVEALAEFEAAWKERIFDRGETTNGDKIGDYSTTPAYFGKEKFIRKSAFKAQGQKGYKGEKITYNKKTGSATISKSNPKTMYLSKGYTEFRDIQGRETKHVNLKFSGSEERAFRTYKFGNEALFGNADSFEHGKIQGQEDKYDEFLTPNQKEEDILSNAIINQAIIVTNGK